MPRQKSIVTIIRDLVRTEIQKALGGLFGGLHVGAASAKPKPKPKNGRRRRRRKSTKGPKGTTPGVTRRRRGGRRKAGSSEG
jgi:hypothetical protein